MASTHTVWSLDKVLRPPTKPFSLIENNFQLCPGLPILSIFVLLTLFLLFILRLHTYYVLFPLLFITIVIRILFIILHTRIVHIHVQYIGYTKHTYIHMLFLLFAHGISTWNMNVYNTSKVCIESTVMYVYYDWIVDLCLHCSVNKNIKLN